jgi:hypothetical protein
VIVGGEVVPLLARQADIEQDWGSKPGVEDMAITSPLFTSITTKAGALPLKLLVGQAPAPDGRW